MQIHRLLTPALDGGECLDSRVGCFIRGEEGSARNGWYAVWTPDHRLTPLEGKQFQDLVELQALFLVRVAHSLLVTTQQNTRRLSQCLLLLIKRYNLFEVLACSTSFFHLSLSCATFFQLRTFIFFIYSKTSSFHRNLGLPVGLLAVGFHLLIFFTLLSSVVRST